MASKIEVFAEQVLKIKLTPYQIEFIASIADGKMLGGGRQYGTDTAIKVWRAYLADGLKEAKQ